MMLPRSPALCTADIAKSSTRARPPGGLRRGRLSFDCEVLLGAAVASHEPEALARVLPWFSMRRFKEPSLALRAGECSPRTHEDCKVLKKGVRHMFSASDFSASENLLAEK